MEKFFFNSVKKIENYEIRNFQHASETDSEFLQF